MQSRRLRGGPRRTAVLVVCAIALVALLWLLAARSQQFVERFSRESGSGKAVASSTPRPINAAAMPKANSSSSIAPKSRWAEWPARSLYLPISAEALAGFRANERKQEKRLARDPAVRAARDAFDASHCGELVPECQFFEEIGCPVTLRKCCVEHMKLRETLMFVLDVVEAAAATAPALQLFLDSGTLLSAVRDGGATLVPWETDVDLGVVGADPALVASLFEKNTSLLQRRRNHYFERCATKDGGRTCKDAHLVYWTDNATAARRLVDTSRVEIWPFDVVTDDSRGGAAAIKTLVHPTRPWLSVPATMVLPLRRDVADVVDGGGGKAALPCAMWGRRAWCPARAVAYLDNEYRETTWRRPRTIHWGDKDVLPWKK